MNRPLKQFLLESLPPLLLLVAFIFLLIAGMTGKMDKVGAALEPFCTKTLPAAVSVVVPESVWHSNFNPRKWHVHYNWIENRTGKFPRR